jgi:hypothetical protein
MLPSSGRFIYNLPNIKIGRFSCCATQQAQLMQTGAAWWITKSSAAAYV